MAAEPQLIDYIKKAKDMGQADDQTKLCLLKMVGPRQKLMKLFLQWLFNQ